jgi:hypothetical protein
VLKNGKLSITGTVNAAMVRFPAKYKTSLEQNLLPEIARQCGCRLATDVEEWYADATENSSEPSSGEVDPIRILDKMNGGVPEADIPLELLLSN